MSDLTPRVITVTSYVGDSHNYLKKLVQAMGAAFTPSMTAANTHLLAAQ